MGCSIHNKGRDKASGAYFLFIIRCTGIIKDLYEMLMTFSYMNRSAILSVRLCSPSEFVTLFDINGFLHW